MRTESSSATIALVIEPPANTFDQSLALIRVASELSRQAQWARADRRRPIYGASGIGWIDLASVIRAKIAAGLLPRDLPKRLRVSRGSGKACDGSEQPITRRHIDPRWWPLSVSIAPALASAHMRILQLRL